jgi:hypothetical protein
MSYLLPGQYGILFRPVLAALSILIRVPVGRRNHLGTTVCKILGEIYKISLRYLSDQLYSTA